MTPNGNDNAPESAPSAVPPKPRRHFIDGTAFARLDYRKERPWWAKAWFLLLAACAILLAIPCVRLGYNRWRPDAAPYTPPAPVDYAKLPGEAGVVGKNIVALLESAAYEASNLTRLLSTLKIDAEVARGSKYDPVATPALLNAVAAAEFTPAEISHPVTLAAVAPTDNLLRAQAAQARAAKNLPRLAEILTGRLGLAAALRDTAPSQKLFAEALAHERRVLAEIRGDAELLAQEIAPLRQVIAALLPHSQAPSPEIAKALATGFDAYFDPETDPGFLAETAPVPNDASGFLAAALANRKPNEQRAEIGALYRRFGDALAKTTFAESRRALPQPGETGAIRVASAFLRKEVLSRLGADPAIEFFFPPVYQPDSSLERLSLQFYALATVDDVYGEALLLRRRAELVKLLAERDRTRFEAGATMYTLVIEHLRRENNGIRPPNTDNIPEALMDRHPIDPFSDDNLRYSRKRLLIYSPGADGVDLSGLEEPEFASDLAQLWEPTVRIVDEEPSDPGAYGLRKADLDKPVIRSSDAIRFTEE